ncbi:tRNA (adenosine(37)-N6)-threonylcarbamoyltransferase complex ATPase subunit type 1 TsaE [Roseovarius faecimaris]|uniref:tRNA threonylcarbamoyladenosine biosynthesis protein TsaE n=1 Tax=Roseovarius faecimaris TaxID=2494550 RepID=A0A6I6IVR1_9RHOB|nr:tRNA (adenosine(37)-N6)-threonylcarbamoyltransferase complex ATPase subunit type 1 TsaE [Roseovarius faecimaris]QGY00165.1 tRNA (adenosine(37)-N6)-threonylcarbamoyltransferase complex ATPase subunit type 1 TsaE [Roseovarius faecimaris]
MTASPQVLLSHSPDHTARIARHLAADLKPGDVLLLSGDIGAGKTHFARSAIQSLLTVPEDIPSPTYTLIQSYETASGEVWHADLYRLSDVSEIEELGLLDAFDTAICLVEWPDRLGDLAPASALSLSFAQGAADDARQIRFDWNSDRWSSLMKELADA